MHTIQHIYKCIKIVILRFQPITANDVGPNANTPSSIENTLTDPSLIKVYPVPSVDFLRIENLPAGSKRLEIFAVSGEKIFEKSLTKRLNSTIEVNIKNLSSGTYFLQISTDTKQFYKKIIFNN